MSAISIRCPLCGNENLFPEQFAGRTLACAHCGEELTLPEDSVPTTTTPTQPQTSPPLTVPNSTRKGFLSRVREFTCRRVGQAIGLILGIYGGVTAGLWFAFQQGWAGGILSIATAPIGGLIGLMVGQAFGRRMGGWIGGRRYGWFGLLVGLCGGLAMWAWDRENGWSEITTAALDPLDWGRLATVMAFSALILGVSVAVAERLFGRSAK
ncbi:hypothetical protein [Thalassoroseus pseudoceratinae]|uniref:hypothetical protein n=1 Tax=Thalassoroseus pseudoceratinae TaxID=2713176 RepID=UPI001424137B|nr:hypothetical protein [Thalassoroseus pseudoceratinae]